MTAQPEPRNLERDRIRRTLSRFAPGAAPLVLAEAVQGVLDYVPDLAVELIARHAGSSPADVVAALEADPRLRRRPRGRHRVSICTGATCARRGGAPLVRQAREALGIDLFTATSDGTIRIEPFRCFGECAMAPNIRIDGKTRGAMTPNRFRLLLDMLSRKVS